MNLARIYLLIALTVLLVQLYIDLGVQQDFYKTEASQNLKHEKLLSSPLTDVEFYRSDKKKFSVAGDELFREKFVPTFPVQESAYRYYELYFPALASYQIRNALFLNVDFQGAASDACISCDGVTV